MTRIDVTLYLDSAFEFFTTEDLAQVDMSATYDKVAELITKRIVRATGVEDVHVFVYRSGMRDYWNVSGTESFSEIRDLDEVVREVLFDFPWWDRDMWAVME